MAPEYLNCDVMTLVKRANIGKTVVIIAGPTASGKSSLAMDLAQVSGGVIVNSDSMQVYQSLPIITACPTAEDRKKIEHRLFEIYHPSVRGNVVDWLKRAVKEIEDIWRKNKLPIVVGGTGLYIDNLINGTTPIPETTPLVRQQALHLLEHKGSLALYEELKKIDPDSAQRLSHNDSVRLLRAYEVWMDTGVALSAWYRKPMIQYLPEAKFMVIKISPPAEELNLRCDRRFDLMIENGALEEVRQLANMRLDPSLPAMKALGVPELITFMQGNCALSEAVALTKVHTRQYAKRQRTWFKNKLKSQIELTQCYNGDFNIVAGKI